MLKFKHRNLLLLLVFMLISTVILTACGGKAGSQETPEKNQKETAQGAAPTTATGTPDGKDVAEKPAKIEKPDEKEESDKREGPNKSGEKSDWKIEIETPAGKFAGVTYSDFKNIGLIDMEATLQKEDDIEEVNVWTGVKLKEVLKFVGIDEYNSVVIKSEDGFSEKYPKRMVDSDKTILATKRDGQDMDTGQGPVRAIVEGERANFWIKQVVKVKVNK